LIIISKMVAESLMHRWFNGREGPAGKKTNAYARLRGNDIRLRIVLLHAIHPKTTIRETEALTPTRKFSRSR